MAAVRGTQTSETLVEPIKGMNCIMELDWTIMCTLVSSWSSSRHVLMG